MIGWNLTFYLSLILLKTRNTSSIFDNKGIETNKWGIYSSKRDNVGGYPRADAV